MWCNKSYANKTMSNQMMQLTFIFVECGKKVEMRESQPQGGPEAPKYMQNV